jgi:hypothetical protein
LIVIAPEEAPQMRRLFLALVVVAAVAGSAVAQEPTATSRVTKQELQAAVDAAPLMPLTLTALFTIAGDQFVSDGVFTPAEVPNVVVARINDDGTISTTCVTTEIAARAFMERRQRDEPARPAEQ